jgi:regulator of sigma E protease
MTSAVAGDVLDNSPASRVGILPGERLAAIDGKPVNSWFGVLEALRQQQPGDVKLTIAGERGPREVAMSLSEDDLKELKQFRFHHNLPLAQLIEERKTKNPLTAMAWGVEETKWSIFNVYITLSRLFEGSVPLSNLSGPIGIFNAGSSAADKGLDWLIWFSALISANLAVVNFLPIPIVDGGLFIFLLMEKLTGKPPSPRLQTAAQLFGLVLLGSLFLFVTYHDVVRLAG